MVQIARVDTSDEQAVATYVRIRNAVAPENGDSAEQVAWNETTYPGESALLLALSGDGAAIGTATVGRVYMYGPTHERFWLGIWVLPDARRRGAGQALYEAASDFARSAGKTGFSTQISEIHEDGLRFLVNRGFVIMERQKMVRLDLTDVAAPDPAPPDGVRILTLAERPDLLDGVHAVAIETFPDIPYDDEPIRVGTLEEFVARDVDRTGIPHDAFMVAVDTTTGMVAGYASLMLDPGDPSLAFHDMTAVLRAYRGRGIAIALKRATIAWAVQHGLRALDTGNDEENGPMRAVNARLGYRPVPDWVGLDGPLAPH